jgi:excisionase family DNA binding protein
MSDDTTPTPGQSERLLVPIGEACEILGGLSRKTVWSMTKTGELPCVRVRRRVLYSPAALQRWVEENTEGGPR